MQTASAREHRYKSRLIIQSRVVESQYNDQEIICIHIGTVPDLHTSLSS